MVVKVWNWVWVRCLFSWLKNILIRFVRKKSLSQHFLVLFILQEMIPLTKHDDGEHDEGKDSSDDGVKT